MGDARGIAQVLEGTLEAIAAELQEAPSEAPAPAHTAELQQLVRELTAAVDLSGHELRPHLVTLHHKAFDLLEPLSRRPSSDENSVEDVSRQPADEADQDQDEAVVVDPFSPSS